MNSNYNEETIETISPNPSTRNVSKLLFSIKSASVFLGTLYGIVFILLLPIILPRTGNVLSGGMLIFLAIFSALLVHFVLNISYYLIIAFPLIMAVIFGGIGYSIWLLSPLIVGFFTGIMDLFLQLFSLGHASLSSYAPINDFITRVGQSFIAISAAIWWFVNKAKDFNYKALTVYIIILGILGVYSGFLSYSYTLVFLFIWGIVYLKVHGDEQPIGDLTKVFKIVATIAIIFGTFNVEVSLVANNILGSQIRFTETTFWNSNGYTLFTQTYGLILSGAIITGIWRPSIFLNRIPPGIKEKGIHILQVISKSVYINKNN